MYALYRRTIQEQNEDNSLGRNLLLKKYLGVTNPDPIVSFGVIVQTLLWQTRS